MMRQRVSGPSGGEGGGRGGREGEKRRRKKGGGHNTNHRSGVKESRKIEGLWL